MKGATHARPPLARMLRIHDQLRAGALPTCASIARELGVSQKTVQRDVDFMRDQLGLPIEYDAPRHGYRYGVEVSSFPTVNVTEGEVVSLLVAQRALEQYRGTPFERALQSAFGKLAASLSDTISVRAADTVQVISFRTSGTAKVDAETFEALARAARERRAVAMDYAKPSARAASRRKAEPLHLTNIDGSWYMLARDPEKKDVRTFALSRMTKVEILDERFVPPVDFSAEDHLAGAFGAFGGNPTVPVKIRFDRFAAPFIRERDWHRSQRLRELRSGEVELSLLVARLEEVENWILSWGAHARVLAPRVLAERIKDVGRQISQLYTHPNQHVQTRST